MRITFLVCYRKKINSVIETELLAITWALDKARHFLMGHIGFKIITDHRPLLGLFDKPLQDISNSRLQRLRMKTIDYSFVLEWCEGKLHKIADALSRYPVSQPTALNPNNDISNIPILSIAGATSNNLIVAAGKDPTYQLILEALQKKTKPMHLHPSHPARTLKPMWSTLSIDSGLIIVDGSRILVPNIRSSTNPFQTAYVSPWDSENEINSPWLILLENNECWHWTYSEWMW